MEASDSLREALLASLAPVQEKLDQLEREITEDEANLAEKRKLRSEARRLIGILDPSTKTTTTKRDTNKWNVSQQKLDALADYLRDNLNGDTFNGASLVAREDFDLMSPATLSKALLALTDQGLTRLDHLGPQGSKVYTLTKAGRGG